MFLLKIYRVSLFFFIIYFFIQEYLGFLFVLNINRFFVFIILLVKSGLGPFFF